MRGDALSRQLILLQLLESRSSGLEIGEAVQALGFPRRTIYRDFEVLQQAGIPLVSELDGRRARWRVMEGYRHRLQLSLTWSEILALSVGARLMAGLEGTLFHAGIASALQKIRSTLPRGLAERTSSAEKQITVSRGGHDYGPRGQFLLKLMEAVETHRTVSARYRSRSIDRKGRVKVGRRPQGPKERDLDPYNIRVTSEGIYVIGWCHQRRAIRTFSLDRFDSVDLTEGTFKVVANFDPHKYVEQTFDLWAGNPRRVRFRVEADLAPLLLERKIHQSQVAQLRADRSLDVEMHVPICPPLISMLAGWGSSVLEIEPEDLLRSVVELHEGAIGRLRLARSVRRGRKSTR